MPECAAGWDSTIHIVLHGGGTITVDAARRKLNITQDLHGEPLAVIHTDGDTLLSMLRGDLPLDLAVMRETLTTNNMIETFKFISVFKPVTAHRKRAATKQPSCRKP